MPVINNNIETLIEAIRLRIIAQAPELADSFEIYANEARFGRLWIDKELKQLKSGDEILEIGAGMFLLACQLKLEGFAITALEPVGNGFSLFNRMKQLVLDYAGEQGIIPPILSCPGEELAENDRFTLAYSLNVMEHVTDVETVLKRVISALKSEGSYRFACPNYHFPYEGHFGIPIIVNKSITRMVMRHKIEKQATYMDDPEGIWASLNWITVTQVKRLSSSLAVRPVFDTNIMGVYIRRATADPIFQARHNAKICFILRCIIALGGGVLIKYMPPEILPVMDCRITKNERSSD